MTEIFAQASLGDMLFSGMQRNIFVQYINFFNINRELFSKKVISSRNKNLHKSSPHFLNGYAL